MPNVVIFAALFGFAVGSLEGKLIGIFVAILFGTIAYFITITITNDSKKKSADHVPIDSEPMPEDRASEGSKKKFSQTISPRGYGSILANSLSETCKIDNITDQEKLLVLGSGLLIETYQKERYILSAIVQVVTIDLLLANSSIRDDVIEGWMNVWKYKASQSSLDATYIQMLAERYDSYREAIIIDQQYNQYNLSDPKSSRMEFVFESNLVSNNMSEAQLGNIIQLARNYVNDYVQSNRARVTRNLRDSGFLN